VLCVIIPFTRFWFSEVQVKCRYPGEESSQKRKIFAEYDLVKRQLIWKEWTVQQHRKNIKVLRITLGVLSIFSVPVIMSMNNFMRRYTYIKATPQQRLGEFWLIAPIALGIFLFLLLNCYLQMIRKRTIIIEDMDKQTEREYFRNIISVRPLKNSKTQKISFPWFRIFGILSIVIYMIFSTIESYKSRQTFLMFITNVLFIAFLLFAFLFILWYLLAGYTIFKKLAKDAFK